LQPRNPSAGGSSTFGVQLHDSESEDDVYTRIIVGVIWTLITAACGFLLRRQFLRVVNRSDDREIWPAAVLLAFLALLMLFFIITAYFAWSDAF
jgi:Kef-type K+ transport system membrane component KefB